MRWQFVGERGQDGKREQHPTDAVPGGAWRHPTGELARSAIAECAQPDGRRAQGSGEQARDRALGRDPRSLVDYSQRMQQSALCHRGGEFGTPTKGWKKGEAPHYLLPKIEVADHLEAIGLPSLRIFPGCFTEFIATLVGYNANKKVNILNSVTGEREFSVTTNPDIGAFVAHLVTHYPLSALANQAFRIEGDRITLKSLAATFNAPIERVNVIPVSPEIPLPSEFVAELQHVTERGLLSIDTVVGEGDGAGGANGMWEGHHWTTVKAYLEGGAK
ncbi:hypothetical protein EV122DRAFT_255388 [Schizophyllum commune]